MEWTHDILRFTHILFGSFSLILFWIPAFARKGSKLHVNAGKAYMLTMAVTVVTAAILSVIMIFFTDRLGLGLFLGFLSLITANPLFFGWKAFRPKPWHIPAQLTLETIISLYSIALIYFGFRASSGANILFFFFGGLGLGVGIGTLISFLRNKPLYRYGVKEHINGMLFSGGAAYTAFLSFGARHYIADLLPGVLQAIPWIAPTILAAIVAAVYRKKYSNQPA